MNCLGELKTTFIAEIDVDQCHVGPKLFQTPQCLGAIGRRADHDQAVTALENLSGSRDKSRVVIDNHTPQYRTPFASRF